MLELNKIYNMDCIEGMKLIPDGSIDCIITDPPYGTTACKRDTVIPFELMREQLKRIIKPNGAIVLFGSEPFSSALRMSNIKNYKYDWIWEKSIPTGNFLAKYQPMKAHENILVFGNKINYFPIKEKRSDNSHSDNKGGIYEMHSEHFTKGTKIFNKPKSPLIFPRSVQKFGSVPRPNTIHPTQKPVALIEYLIKTYTNEGELVLDFTMGSGTTAIACLNTNRNFIGFELDKGYREIANKRLENRK